MYGMGISREGSILDVAVELGFVKKSGAWYTYEGEQLGQGRENAKQFLHDTPELAVELNHRIRQGTLALVPAAVRLGANASDDEPMSIED
jgi:recombination protein RecA